MGVISYEGEAAMGTNSTPSSKLRDKIRYETKKFKIQFITLMNGTAGYVWRTLKTSCRQKKREGPHCCQVIISSFILHEGNEKMSMPRKDKDS